MSNYDIYKDIATRTKGDIYVGVVGPVRTGKSTFITKMLNALIIPNIADGYSKERTIDEMPQSGDGKSIMTTQPKFIPNESVPVVLNNDVQMNMRLIDCVGYLVDGAVGHIENDKPRMVATPWSSDKMPFEKAAELGTQKVITSHSTVGVLVTTDGSFTSIPRENYVKAEERVVSELKACNKPFVVVLNSTHPDNAETKALVKALTDKYGVGVIATDVSAMTEQDINDIFALMLNEFPVASVCVRMPQWMQALPFEHPLITTVANAVTNAIKDINKIGDIGDNILMFEGSQDFEAVATKDVLLGEGKVVFEIKPKDDLFYRVLSEQCGHEITSEYHLVSYVKQLTAAKEQYDKFKTAIEQVKETGYGVVHPTMADMKLEEPEIVKSGGRYGVKLKASAPSLHIMQVDIETEVNPVVGSEQQSADLAKYLLEEFENNPTGIWETKMFGKSLDSLVNEGIQGKLVAMPTQVQNKMRKTLGRIVNEGKGGVICILL